MKPHKERLERAEYMSNILKSVLFFSRVNGKFMFPSTKEYLLSELVNGTIEYVGGDSGEIIYKRGEGYEPAFEYQIEKYFKEQMELHSEGKLDLKVKNALDELVEIIKSDTSFRSPELNTMAYFFLGFIYSTNQPKFSLTEELLIKIPDKIIPNLSDFEKKDIKGIGECMRPFIEKDLKSLKKLYGW